MKKLFLFVAAASLALTSCGSDDSGSSSNGGSMKFKVDGVQKNFNHVVVSEQTYYAGTPDEYVQLTVTGSNTGSATEFVTFYMDKNSAGSDAVYEFDYSAAGDFFYDDNMNVIVETSTEHKIKGTFSGTVVNMSGNVTKTLTDGTFNVSY